MQFNMTCSDLLSKKYMCDNQMDFSTFVAITIALNTVQIPFTLQFGAAWFAWKPTWLPCECILNWEVREW